mmetsp:Transcript_47796/g.126517  ORF Transcript_47796/g.126517 Transcript_47796/m.126517 type:complete len:365 (-) Transcript_47796:15-1109(-)
MGKHLRSHFSQPWLLNPVMQLVPFILRSFTTRKPCVHLKCSIAPPPHGRMRPAPKCGDSQLDWRILSVIEGLVLRLSDATREQRSQGGTLSFMCGSFQKCLNLGNDLVNRAIPVSLLYRSYCEDTLTTAQVSWFHDHLHIRHFGQVLINECRHLCFHGRGISYSQEHWQLIYVHVGNQLTHEDLVRHGLDCEFVIAALFHHGHQCIVVVVRQMVTSMNFKITIHLELPSAIEPHLQSRPGQELPSWCMQRLWNGHHADKSLSRQHVRWHNEGFDPSCNTLHLHCVSSSHRAIAGQGNRDGLKHPVGLHKYSERPSGKAWWHPSSVLPSRRTWEKHVSSLRNSLRSCDVEPPKVLHVAQAIASCY